MRTNDRTRGQALVVAIFILAILSFIAIMFWRTTRAQVQIASNVQQSISADLIADAGVAIAQGFLRADATLHPSYTSLDHAWRTYFNGTWYQGKEWARRLPGGPLLDEKPVPHVRLADLLAADVANELLYVPREQGLDLSDFTGAFVIDPLDLTNPTDPTDPRIADVDLSGDGLNDAVWIPVPRDIFFTDDGLDNNLNGLIDEGPHRPVGDPLRDYPPERAIFCYFDFNEGRVLLTAPLVDPDGDPLPPFQVLRDTAYWDDLGFTDDALFTVDPGNPDHIDGAGREIDNDFSLIIDDARQHFIVDTGLPGPPPFNPMDRSTWSEIDRQLGHHPVNTVAYPALGPFTDTDGSTIYLTSTGEPVCEIVGRIAVLITDEASRANLNTAGALTMNELWRAGAPTTAPPVYRSLGAGAGPYEYETRVLPGIGVALSSRMAMIRTGAEEGIGGGSLPAVTLAEGAGPFAALNYDISLPGYGLVDDDGSALWASLQGIDYNASGWGYDGIIPSNYGAGYALGQLQGIDAPSEFRLFRPYRNYVAEGDTVGAFGDWYFREKAQIRLVQGIGPAISGNLAPFATTFSFDRNDRISYFDETGALRPLARRSGPKLDYNHARGMQFAEMLENDWGYVIGREIPGVVAGVQADFALHLLSPELSWEPLDLLGTTMFDGTLIAEPFPADPGLRAYQLGAMIEDARDPDPMRTTLTARVTDPWDDTRDIEYTVSGIESIRINEIMVRPVRRLEAEGNVAGNNPLTGDPEPARNVNAFAPNSFDYDVMTLETRSGVSPDFGPVPASGAEVGWTPVSGWQHDGTPYAGPGGYIRNTQSVLDGVTTTDGDPLGVSDVVQFLIAPSPELPPGRYYLLVNTIGADGDRTVDGPGDLEYVTKYVWRGDVPAILFDGTTYRKDVGPTDVLHDVYVQEFLGEDLDPGLGGVQAVPWRTSPLIGGNAIGHAGVTIAEPADTEAALGWVFLPTDNVRSTAVVPGYWQDDAFTIEVPPAAGDPNDQVYLCVAFRRPAGAAGTLALNFLEFSQEPNHEWIELVNIAERPDYMGVDWVDAGMNAALVAKWRGVDVSGWQVEVGMRGNSDRVIMTLPDGVVIPPGGKILVAANRGDDRPGYASVPPAWDLDTLGPLFFRNGIGLTREDTDPLYAHYAGITVPPIPNTLGGPSVFEVPDPDWPIVPAATTLAGLPNLGSMGRLDSLYYAAEIATVVLRGGIFPNYPERDLVDNDGDGWIDEGNPETWLEAFADLSGAPWDPAVDPFLYGASPVPGGYSDTDLPLDLDTLGDPAPLLSGLVSADDSLHWRHFIERRFLPGDAVLVTLYEGPASNGRVVDRVTYTERDVINRSPDDGLDVPAGMPSLNPTYPTMWPDDTAAVDFYRSLERKHPFYTGNRFGLRDAVAWVGSDWERFDGARDATDGNYDDWDISPPPYRGSPLEPNRFRAAVEDLLVHPDRWPFQKVRLRNAKFRSAADFLELPSFLMTVELDPPAASPGWRVDNILLGRNQRIDGDSDAVALISNTTADSLVLSAARADFYPLTPDLAAAAADPTLVQFNPGPPATWPRSWAPIYLYSLDPLGAETPGDTQDLTLENWPEASPAYEYPFQLNFLLNPPAAWPPGVNPAADLPGRWPLERRAVMYAGVGNGAEALFVWNIEDGLENGEYDAYIVTTDDLTPLFRGQGIAAGIGAALPTTAFGTELLAMDRQARLDWPATDPDYFTPRADAPPVDIEFFTDRDGNGNCWTTLFPEAAAGSLDTADSVGTLVGARPNAEGIIHFGVVSIRNHFLALRLTNAAQDGVLNRFSRVVLAPRDKTFGRININTAQTAQIPGTGDLFNPLIGVPGVLWNSATGYLSVIADYGPADAEYADAMDLANAIVAGRWNFADGRYYYTPADLLFYSAPGGVEEPTGIISPHAPSSQAYFDEVLTRFSRMTNLITTRSDVFEIIVLAQSGYIKIDAPAHGWREDEYFEVLGEKRVRTVYER